MRSACGFAIVAFALLLPLTSLAQEAYVPLEQRLSPEQLRETGLDGLSGAQLERLNALLRAERVAHTVAVREEVEQKAARGTLFQRDREPVVTRIAGEFRGWSNGTRFQLENGQTWRVIDTPEYYIPRSKFLVSPAVTLSPGLIGGWSLQVEGHSVRAKVQRVK